MEDRRSGGQGHFCSQDDSESPHQRGGAPPFHSVLRRNGLRAQASGAQRGSQRGPPHRRCTYPMGFPAPWNSLRTRSTSWWTLQSFPSTANVLLPEEGAFSARRGVAWHPHCRCNPHPQDTSSTQCVDVEGARLPHLRGHRRFLLSTEQCEGTRQLGGDQAGTEPVCDYTHPPVARQNPPKSL